MGHRCWYSAPIACLADAVIGGREMRGRIILQQREAVLDVLLPQPGLRPSNRDRVVTLRRNNGSKRDFVGTLPKLSTTIGDDRVQQDVQSSVSS